jgi:hypothetical protein
MEANLCLCSRFEWKRTCVCVVVVNGSESVFVTQIRFHSKRLHKHRFASIQYDYTNTDSLPFTTTTQTQIRIHSKLLHKHRFASIQNYYTNTDSLPFKTTTQTQIRFHSQRLHKHRFASIQNYCTNTDSLPFTTTTQTQIRFLLCSGCELKRICVCVVVLNGSESLFV